MSTNVNAAFTANVPPVAVSAFRDAMRQLPGGVSVITAGIGEDRSGMTVISVASLAIDPPSIVACVNRQSSTWPLLQRYRVFGVNILGAGQQAVADRFTGRSGLKGTARFADARWITLVTGVWLLSDALAALDCDVEELIDRDLSFDRDRAGEGGAGRRRPRRIGLLARPLFGNNRSPGGRRQWGKKMNSHVATIIDFGAYRERKGPAISALGLRRSEAMPNFAFMIIRSQSACSGMTFGWPRSRPAEKPRNE
jgi:flavin reductase (DIM6/NTAB) family NADH-FMN oxidoreductase RutF